MPRPKVFVSYSHPPGYDFAALSRSLGLALDPSHALEARVQGRSR